MLPDKKSLREYELRPISDKKLSLIPKIKQENKRVEYVIDFSIESIKHRKILCVKFFNIKEQLIEYCSFVYYRENTKEFDYIALKCTKPINWYSSEFYRFNFISNFISDSIYSSNWSVLDDSAFYKYFNIADKSVDPFRFIDKHIYEKREISSLKKAEEKQKNIDKLFSVVPDAPKRFIKFAKENMPVNYGLFDYGKSDFLCSHCNNHFTVNKKHKNGDEIICPHCKKKLEARTKKSRKRSESKNFSIIQKFKGDLLYRVFNFDICHSEGGDKVGYHEWFRSIISLNGDRPIRYLNDRGWKQKKVPAYNYIFPKPYFWYQYDELYKGNLNTVLKNTPFYNNGVKDILKKDLYANTDAYFVFDVFALLPKTELLYKAGISNVIELCHNNQKTYKNFDWKALSPKDILGLTKEQFSYFKSHSLSFEHIESLRLVSHNGKINFSDYDELRNIEMGYKHSYSYYCRAKEYKKICDAILKVPQSAFQCLKYLKKQKREIVADWADYIKEIKVLEYKETDMIVFPRDLNKAHRFTSNLVRADTYAVYDKQITEQYNKTQKYEYQINDLLFKIPRNFADLRDEGANLGHCVATYSDNVAEGTSVIVLVRNFSQPEKSLYTMELNPTNLRIKQLRGKGNKDAPDEVRCICETYTDYLYEKFVRAA